MAFHQVEGETLSASWGPWKNPLVWSWCQFTLLGKQHVKFAVSCLNSTASIAEELQSCDWKFHRVLLHASVQDLRLEEKTISMTKIIVLGWVKSEKRFPVLMLQDVWMRTQQTDWKPWREQSSCVSPHTPDTSSLGSWDSPPRWLDSQTAHGGRCQRDATCHCSLRSRQSSASIRAFPFSRMWPQRNGNNWVVIRFLGHESKPLFW